MLSIGEFSNICKVSKKTLRYYDEIGLILPSVINEENGYRYYSIEQLETMLFINRLKSYKFSLDEIKSILELGELKEEKLYFDLILKKREIERQVQELNNTLEQISDDILTLEQGKSIMSYLDNIDIELVEMPSMYILYIRKMVYKQDLPEEYGKCFGKLLKKIKDDKLTMISPPMVLFHSSEYTTYGLDTEFAIPVKEFAKGTREFNPGLCIKTVLKGPYSELTSVYTKQREYAEKEGYKSTNALFEVYVTDPNEVTKDSDLITEVYYPVKKK